MDETPPIISLLRNLKAELERRGELARTDSAASGIPFSELWSAGRARGLRESAELIEYLMIEGLPPTKRISDLLDRALNDPIEYPTKE